MPRVVYANEAVQYGLSASASAAHKKLSHLYKLSFIFNNLTFQTHICTNYANISQIWSISVSVS